MIKVTFLGTSYSIPTPERNHTGILLTYKGENILIDCGEGIQRQFKIAKISMSKITRILLTHWHGDHVLGLPGLLQTLSLGNQKKNLFIYGPKGIKKHISQMLDAFPFQLNYKISISEVSGKFFENDEFILESKEMTHGIPCNAYSFVKKGKLRIDKGKLKKSKLPHGPLLKQLTLGKDVIHGGKKYKYEDLTYEDKGLKISFVLDTSINNKIAPFVKNSDLLICESTFHSELEKEAMEKKHLTAKQAGEIAKKSNSKKLLLTHISDRYKNDLLKLLEDAKKVFKNSHMVKDFDIVDV
ncbi:ribonuclease Z [Candidatus Pacearchaeota archaeon]|nr:ribonuclease Z [Candidatus Pacearchaeota archaeon]